MGYPGGGLAQISSAFRSPFHTHIEIIGTEGRLVSTRPFVGMENERYLTVYDRDGQVEELAVPEKMSLTSSVFSSKPLLLHNSVPWVPSSAEK